MKSDISKSRIRRIVSLRRKKKTSTAPVTFRNSSWLAVAYLLICIGFSIGSLLCANLLTGFSGPRIGYVIGLNVALLIASALAGRLLLGQLAPEILARNSRILMLCCVVILTNLLQTAVLVGVFRMHESIPFFCPLTQHTASATCTGLRESSPFLMPFLFAPALATLVAGSGAGFAIGIVMAIQNLFFVPQQTVLPIILIGLMIAVTAPRLLRRVYHRSGLLRVFAVTGLLQVTGVLVHLIMRCYFTHPEIAPSLFLRTDLIFTLISILIDFVATVAVLPVVEHIFGACSNIRLSAYADYNSELLMRMDLEAPGTCQHAKNVADLAAAAAEHIGANALLARVGGLYHDIGKLNSPEYFSENIQPGTPNPHDSLPPTISAVILSAHVKDGIAMAIDNNLPYPVQQIIRTHHGNSLMPFFYKKAVSLAEAHAKQTGTEPEPVDESSFRYASPRPNTLEAAIVSLADGIEAASRSLTHKTTVSIERLVTAIIDSKMQDGQLDEAPLSCRQLAELKRVFTSRLTTILHARIPYTDEEAKKSIAALPGEVKSAVAAAQTPAPHPELPIPSGSSGS